MKTALATIISIVLYTPFVFFVNFALGQIEPTPVQCGTILESEFTVDRMEEDFVIEMAARDLLSASVTMLNPNVGAGIAIRDPSSTIIDSSYQFGEARVGEVIIGGTGTYLIKASGTGIGIYTLSIGCALANGIVIDPGESANTTVVEDGATLIEVPAFVFPGIAPRDFVDGIEIPLIAGQPQTVPVGSDVALYTYDAAAGQTATLTATRVGGDISAGIGVINRDTNEIVFIGGMPYTDSVSANITFPADGTYAIGIFRLDTPTLTGTSGALQISIE
ncbi:MAG: hypothetical protein AAFU54_00110 [Chloroflexota bacterium]